MKLRIGIDVGGTFTDVTAFDEDAGALMAVRKYPSDPARPAAVTERIADDLATDFGANSAALILHGSTAALNTLLQGNGARVGLITTRGFRDIYEIGRQWRGDEVFNIFPPAPKMLLTRERILEVRERLDASGAVIEALDEAEIAEATRQLVAQGVEAVAVCFLFAFANPAHERIAAKIIADIAPGLYVSLSHEVNPEWREYERTASTVANAYIGPPVLHYLRELDEQTSRHFPRSRTLMMKSDGGAASARMLERTPIETVMSGPVAGVIGGRYLGDLKKIENIITFDAGGTSSDMAVLPGPPLFKSEFAVARHPLRTHTVDIETIGAGGGSIAHVDLGALKVGPRSAGADPGPACYDRGGTEPTLTDALVMLGHLNPTALLDGAMPISRARAWAAIDERVAQPLSLMPMDAAWGILSVLTTNVIMAMRTITIERGYDPREFTLVPFGGMGPSIAGRIIGELGIARILVPRDPGAFSAFGMLVTDVRRTRRVTRITRLDSAKPAELEATFAAMEETALAELLQENLPRHRLSALRSADMRYRGQSYEVSVPVFALQTEADIAALAKRFHDAHRRRYGHMAESEAVEIVNFQVTAVGEIPKPQLQEVAPTGQAPTPDATRAAYFSPDDAIQVPVFRRSTLAAGAAIVGPAIIEEQTSTVVLYPGQSAHIDGYFNIEIAPR